MFCYECGTQVADGTRFCPICGSPLPGEDEPLEYHDAGGVRPAGALDSQQTAEGRVTEALVGEGFDGLFKEIFEGEQPKAGGQDATPPMKPSIDRRTASGTNAPRGLPAGLMFLGGAVLFVCAAFCAFAGGALVYFALTGQVRSEAYVTPVLIGGIVLLFIAITPIILAILGRRNRGR